MAPSYSRQLLVFAVPTIAVLLSYFWFKRKRSVKQSDPGDIPAAADRLKGTTTITTTITEASEAKDILPRTDARNNVTPDLPVGSASSYGSPNDSNPRVLSTPSTPIDIVVPRERRSHRTSPVVISDEDLDQEIEKVKSMRSYSAEQALSKLSGGSDNSRECEQEHQAQRLQVTPKANKFSMPSEKSEFSPIMRKSPTKESSPPLLKGANNDIANKMAKVEDRLNNLKLSPKEKKSDQTDKNKKKNVVATETPVETIPNVPVEKSLSADAHLAEEFRPSSERDSANHSPADVMLASPSLSCISDNHSEGSSDSGKGGSDVATPPSRTPAGDADPSSALIYYEFTIPQQLVGKLIGRFGSFITEIKDKTRAHVLIKRHPTSTKLKLCSIEGCQADIDKALKLIRERFPVKKFPEVTLEQVSLSTLPPVSNLSFTTDHLYSKLVEGVNNDTIISCMVTPGHLFLQQPTHPSFPHLQVLSNCMMLCYNSDQSPVLPKPIQESTVCVAQSVGVWYRAMILSTDEENDTSYVLFLDYGGYAIIPNDQLRPIRRDFLMLPFQAAECHLANIRPVGGDNAQWCPEAYTTVAELTKGALALTQIAEYTEAGIPLVLMYIILGGQEVVFLNDELVKRGFAEYIRSTAIDEYYHHQEQHALQEGDAHAFADDVEGAVGGVLA